MIRGVMFLLADILVIALLVTLIAHCGATDTQAAALQDKDTNPPKQKQSIKDGWNPNTQYFTSVEGRFRIKFPGEPVAKGKTVSWREGDNTLLVEYYDIDGKKKQGSSVEKLLDEIQASQMNTWGKDDSPKSIKLGEHPGRELVMVNKGKLFIGTKIIFDRGAMVRCYLVNSRVYVISASEVDIDGWFHGSLIKAYRLLTTSFELLE